MSQHENAVLNHPHNDLDDSMQNDAQGQQTKSHTETLTNRKMSIAGADNSRVHYNPSEAPQYEGEGNTYPHQDHVSSIPTTAPDDQPVFTSHRPLVQAPSIARAERTFWFRTTQTLGVLGSIGWAVLCFTYFLLEGGIATQTPYEMGIFIAGMTAPVAFFWMLLSYLQRNNDVQYYAESLRAEMHSLFFPSEEDSRRVNKDIERMTEQAAEFAASSRAALKAIHTTRQGLRNEIKEFSTFARKAEGHLISLSDNLVERTGSMSGLIETMESRIANLNDQSGRSITAWDEASIKMIERADEIESAMDSGASRILSMADVAEEKTRAVSEMFDGTITSLGMTVDAVSQRLGGINDQVGAHTRTMQLSSEELAKETGRLSAMITDQIEQLQDAAGRSVETITQSLVAVSDQKDLLEGSATILTAKANQISDVINGSVLKLTETSEDIISRAEETERRLSEKASLIASTMDGVEDQIDRIESVSELASHRLSEGIDTAVNGSNQISDTVRRAVEMLTQTSKASSEEATALIESTITHIQQLKDVGQGNVSSVESMVDLLEKSRIQIERASTTAAAHVETLTQSVETQSDRLELSAVTLADQVKSVARSLDEPLRLVGVAIADADGRHEQIQDTLERRVADLRAASEQATESVEIIRQSLREQTTDISTLSARVVAQAKTLNQELSENKSYLSSTIDTTLEDMNRLMSGLGSHTGVISNQAVSLINDITSATQTLQTTATCLQDAGDYSEAALNKAAIVFTDKAALLENGILSAEDKIESANRHLTFAAEKILPLYDRVETGSQQALETLTEFKDSYSDIAETTLTKIDYATMQFDDRLVKLKGGAGEATALLKTSTESLREQLNDIEYAAETAHGKMHKLTNAMEGQSSDIHILTDQATLKIESLQKLINGQFQELSISVGQAMEQIEEAGLHFNTRANQISQDANLICQGFASAGDEAYEKAYNLKQAAVNIAEVSGDSVTKLITQMDQLNEKSEGSLFNLRKTSDTLAIKSKEVDVMMQSVLAQSKSYSNDMREQVRAAAEQSDMASTQISKSISGLLGTMDDMNTKTKSVVSYIHDTNQSLYDQSGRFVTAVAKSAQAAEHATEIFSQQTDNLLKASRVAVEKIADIRNTEVQAGRETFLASARFVLESLHSLSVDFVRMTDGEINDKDWKAYQKGDIAIFTTKMAGRLDQMPADKIRHKYAEDSEFRNYVQKFMRQFEDVLDQTTNIDRGAILGTTFAASDVGKIYRYLCQITGKNDKIAA